MDKIKKNKKGLASDGKSISDLILFSISAIISSNEVCSFDRLIKECFVIFPAVFGFNRYPLWPDARKLDRPLRALRRQGLITGDPKISFLITKTGKEKAEQIQKLLRQGKLL